MRNDANVPMDLRILKVDITEHLTEKVFKEYPAIKRVFEVHIYDRNIRTFLAEMTPSYELHFLEHQWDGDWDRLTEEQREDYDNLMYELTAETEIYSYMHTSTVDHAGRFRPGFFPKGKLGTVSWEKISVKRLQEEYEGNRDEAMQDAIEDFFGNPI